ncbi:MAG: co-chaperone GroES [Chitinophagaceae bacterium]
MDNTLVGNVSYAAGWLEFLMTTITNNRKLKPLGQRVLVRRLEKETTTAGGIILAESAQETNIKAVVQEVGYGDFDDEGRRIEFHVKPGDLVLVRQGAGTAVSCNKGDCHIIHEGDILAKLEE